MDLPRRSADYCRFKTLRGNGVEPKRQEDFGGDLIRG